ncbi:MAG: hypothetical protein AAF483_01225 [Planctomycetota bacterium]
MNILKFNSTNCSSSRIAFRNWGYALILMLTIVAFQPLLAQDETGAGEGEGANAETAEVSDGTEIAEAIATGQAAADDGTRRIIIETAKPESEPPAFHSAIAKATVQVGKDLVLQTIDIDVKILQGKPKTITFGLNGPGDVKEVQGENVDSWSVRQKDGKRFLDLHVSKEVEALKVQVKAQFKNGSLPTQMELLHIAPESSVGFDSRIAISYASGIVGTLVSAEGFAPLEAKTGTNQLQSATGGVLKLRLDRRGALPAAVELVGTSLEGELHSDQKSMSFRLAGTAEVTEAGSEIVVLSGGAAISSVPETEDFRLKLATVNKQQVYKLVFPEVGTFPLELDFVAKLARPKANWQSMDFTIAASAVVPMKLKGLAEDLEFEREAQTVVPFLDGSDWSGFLPATGRVNVAWKTASSTGEGKLFFTTAAHIEASVGPGLLRQDHKIGYQVLQGQLKALRLKLQGPGEILNVEGGNIVAWKVDGEGEERTLDITLSQPITGSSQINVRSQTAVGAFPVRVAGLSITPEGAVRHSGFVRISNSGSVRVEPTGLAGLTQLAPEQFPGQAIQARQVFVYRFPAAEHAFTIAADRIQPEVNIAEVILYKLSESDKVIVADIEMDIREAAIREWSFTVPADYSIVSVSGANLADYVAATEVADGSRNLKVVFAADVQGRQLITMQLEKNEVAAAGDWVLPKIEFPEAKTVRGDVGVVGAAGFRIAASATDLLVEKPLSYFPKPDPNLQQAYRIREPGWTATMQIELLERSIQSDVFHLYSLSQGVVYGSALINYFVTGAPTSELQITVPTGLGNIMVDGQDIRTWRREGDTTIVSLHQPVMGSYTLLVTYEEKPNEVDGSFQAATIAPNDVQADRGYIQVVSPMQVELETVSISNELLVLDPLELPAEFRLLSTAPALGTWQYTERPFDLKLKVNWFEPGSTATQVVEFSEANSRVVQDGEQVTDIDYYVKSRGQSNLRLRLPAEPVKLWSVAVNGQPVTARVAGDDVLVPLQGQADPNLPVEVSLRLGKPAVDEQNPVLALPTVFAPVLKTQWRVLGDENHALVSSGGTVEPTRPVLRPSGFDWMVKNGVLPLLSVGFLVILGSTCVCNAGFLRLLGLVFLGIAIAVACGSALDSFEQTGPPSPLQLNLPVLSGGETVEVQVQSIPLWRVNISWLGVALAVGGFVLLIASFLTNNLAAKRNARLVAVPLICVGILLQGDGAPWFFGLLALGMLALLFLPAAKHLLMDTIAWMNEKKAKKSETKSEAKEPASSEGEGGDSPGVATTILTFLALSLAFASQPALAADEDDFHACDSITQNWNLASKDSRLSANGRVTLSGVPGDRFVLLRAPAILTKFEGDGLRLTKKQVPSVGLAYVITIPLPENADENGDAEESKDYEADFEYQVEAVKPGSGIAVLSGLAAIQQIELSYDESGWDVVCPTAVRVEPAEAEDKTQAKILLGPGAASVSLRPQARDISSEDTKFFVEGSNLYIAGPGVVDGRHRLNVRTSQGQVKAMTVTIPEGLTVSAVGGPVSAWQFDADNRQLSLEIESSQSPNFEILIETQRGLDTLPADLTVAPVRVLEADGEVGLIALAFGPDAQPEKMEATAMSMVNLGDFDAALLAGKQAVIQRVYRYGEEDGAVSLRVAPVDSEVRVVSRQVISLGDERVVLAVNFAAAISRAGLFKLSFPLPDGLEVESLTGDSLHHWSELTEGDQRQIILHLKGKTIGAQSFSLTLAGNAPTEVGDWAIPRFELNESSRQTGDLVVRPITGIRLRTVVRQNVSEVDPRSVGGQGQGALAFRLLQQDWNLTLGIEKLEPWVTGNVLHDVTLREGQTRSALFANFNIQNASIRTLQVSLPGINEDEIKTLRASGSTISDFVRTADDSDVWEIQFKRRVIGRVQFQIEYERRGDRANESENLNAVGFPEARKIDYYFSIRTGGRLQIEAGALPQGWQSMDWNTVPEKLRLAGNRNAPALTLRAGATIVASNAATAAALNIRVQRHSLADALKLRVDNGTLTTVLSPTGDQLTAVDVTMEVIQRSSLSVELPAGGELFSIFVNGESVHSIRQSDNENAWQFYILPGIDDRTANVRFVYSLKGDQLRNLKLVSPLLNVPLENVRWNVIAPEGFQLTDDDGNMELIGEDLREAFGRDSYLSIVSGKREVQAQQAVELLEQANELLQAGEQTKARWALNSVANQYALDAASNEDARVQLENLQTQQAIVGLNTRRQRLFLYNKRSNAQVEDNEQLLQAAEANPILQMDKLNFRPQELSQLLRGNTSEDNAVLQQIAGRLVRHQRTTEPAPQAIIISIPEEGTAYQFSRSVQVAENAPLELDLGFESEYKMAIWQWLLVAAFVVVVAISLSMIPRGSEEPA